MKRRVPKTTIIPKPSLFPYIKAELEQQIADGKAILHLKKPLLDEYGKWVGQQVRHTLVRTIYYYKGHAVVEDDPHEGQAGFDQFIFRGALAAQWGLHSALLAKPRRNGKLKGINGV